MAKTVKLKTKDIPFGNKAKEIEAGVWEFTTGKVTWRYYNRAGFNFGPVVEKDGENMWSGMLCIKNLEQAALFAEGYHAGFSSGWNTSQQQLKKAANVNEEPGKSDGRNNQTP